MSTDPFQPGHRARSPRRFRHDGEPFGQFGDTPFGGNAEAAAEADGPATVTWNPGGATQWAPATSGTVWAAPTGVSAPTAQPAPAGSDRATRPGGDSWEPSTDSGEWNAWDASADPHDDYDYPAADTDDEPFDLARLDNARARPAFDDGDGAGLGGRRTGAHRLPVPPTALKGRAAVVAVAAGAAVAAGQAGMESTSGHHTSSADYEAAGQVHAIAAQAVSTDTSGGTPQVLNPTSAADISQFQDILHHGQQFAAGLAAQEAAKLRPLFIKFASGTFTSGFGSRWGVLHPGVDVAAPIGTPIYAVEDGTVIDAGPASGFGMWVRLKHDDGTVTVYGHVNTTTVSVGQRVTAGDQIATVGNRGFSTGPHCHFEVWLDNGTNRIDPLPWLASRGISLGPEID